jgi:protein-disulfide isomerase-like protein with CxxC motif
MKPAWDKLIEEFKDSKSAVVADVDCTAGGKDLCEQIGVRGYPTIKHGDPNNLEDYKGGRDFDSLKKFAEENLGPTCGPGNLDLCDDDKKAAIEKYSKMAPADLEAAIKEKTDAIEKLETDFKTMLEGLQKEYSEGNEKKEKDVEAIKNSGMGLMKAVVAHKKSSGKEEL